MNLVFSPKSQKQLLKLSPVIRKKFYKQINLLENNRNHPSLHLKKMVNQDIYEVRIDLHYRFSFVVKDDIVNILAVGPHDEGLGKK